MTSESDLALVRLKRWRLLRNWLIWGFLPGILVLSDLLMWVTDLKYSALIVIVVWMIGTVYSARRVQLWPCPNCGKPVMKKGWFHNDFSSKCLHCGLSLKPTAERISRALEILDRPTHNPPDSGDELPEGDRSIRESDGYKKTMRNR
jgi:hypothetical protein